MIRSVEAVLVGLAISMLTGCFVVPEYRTSPEPAFTNPRSAWVIGEPKSATVGDLVLAEGAEIRTGPAYELVRPLAFSMPGTFGVQFLCTLQPCVLEPRGIVGDQLLFTAPQGAGTATFDGESVFSPEDELGIRVDRETGRVRLYCDNSRFNKTFPGLAVWSRSATPEERDAFKLTSCERLCWLPRNAALRYSGASSGEVRFTYTRYKLSEQSRLLEEIDSTEYRFDSPAGGRGEIAVRGAVIELLSISPTELRYIVKRGFALPSEREAEPVPPAPSERKDKVAAADVRGGAGGA
jgi:hypothetical protein